jgi:hypothetical protein
MLIKYPHIYQNSEVKMFKLFLALTLCVSNFAEGMLGPKELEEAAYRKWSSVPYSSEEYFFHEDMASNIAKAKINAGMDDSNVSAVGHNN